MFAWKYLKAGFWQRIPLPLLGRVPLNAAALAGFSVAGFDNSVFWAVGAGWQAAWLTLTAGQVSFRRKVDAARHRELWRALEERRLQLYNLLSLRARQQHHQLLTLLRTRLRNSADPAPPAMELLSWFHLKMLLVRQSLAGNAPTAQDPDIPRLHALAAVEITDPGLSGFANDILALLDSRQGIRDATRPLTDQLDDALARIHLMLSGETPASRHGNSIPSSTPPDLHDSQAIVHPPPPLPGSLLPGEPLGGTPEDAHNNAKPAEE